MTSNENAFLTSCENIDDFPVAAIVHTHPYMKDFRNIDNFSMGDFNLLIEYREKGYVLEKMVMINERDRYIRTFGPARPTDRQFTLAHEAAEAILYPELVDVWNEYTKRVNILCAGPASKLPGCVM